MRQSIFFCTNTSHEYPPETIIFKIKHHKQNGMEANVDFIRNRFQTFNQKMFGGELPLPIIKTGKARRSLGTMACDKKRTAWGKVTNCNFRMTISTMFDLPEDEIEDIIIHEMIHYYIMYKQLNDTSAHGKLFRQIMTSINSKFNRHVYVSRKGDNTAAYNSDKPRYICITELKDGRTGITVAAKTRIFELWKMIPALFHTKKETWYWSCDPYFNKYPSCIKPKIYIADKKEIESHLENAMELQNNGRVIKRK